MGIRIGRIQRNKIIKELYMTNNNKQIKDLINEGLSIISLMKIRSDSLAGSKNTKVYNILRKLRESGKIVNQTIGNKSIWSLAKI